MTSSSLTLPVACVVGALLPALPARADVPGQTGEQAGRAWIMDGQVGPAFLTRSRSRAIGHAWKPVARLGLRRSLMPRLEVGGTLSAIIDSSEHYRVLGVLGHARLVLLQKRPAFTLGAALALGAGYDADILHGDLRAEATVVPYGFVAMDARWSIGRRTLVGIEAGWENLAIIRVGLLVGIAFEPGQPSRSGS